MVNKRIAVTGGSGFLGAAVVEEARRRGHASVSFDRLHGGDILGDLSGLQGSDTIVHLAGILGTSELFETPELAVDVNIKGTIRVLEWCRKNGASFVGISLPAVFPSVYTATKVAARRMAMAWHSAYGVPVSHVRAFNVYGPGQAYGPGHPQKIVPTFSRMAWDGKPLPVWGDGNQTMDLVHVDDVAEMLVDATDFGKGEIFDAGTGVAVTVNEFANTVLELTGSKAGIEHFPMRPGEEPTQIVARGSGWNELGWRPVVRHEALEKTIRSYRNA